MSSTLSSYGLSTIKPIEIPGKHNYDKTTTLQRNASTSFLQRMRTTPQRSMTPGTTMFRISVEDFRHEKSNKMPRLKQAQTDNYYNTKNSSLSLKHYQSYRMNGECRLLSDNESESDLVLLNNAYSQYITTSTFPDSRKIDAMEPLTVEDKHKTVHIRNDSSLQNMDDVYIGMGTKYRCNKSEIKLSKLFKQTADKVLVLLKEKELQMENESKQENNMQRLMTENLRLKAENNKLYSVNQSLHEQIKDLQETITGSENKVADKLTVFTDKKYRRSWKSKTVSLNSSIDSNAMDFDINAHELYDGSQDIVQNINNPLSLTLDESSNDSIIYFMNSSKSDQYYRNSADSEALQHRTKCSFSGLSDESKDVIKNIANKSDIAITPTYRRKTTKPKHKNKRKRKSAKIRLHIDNLDIENKETMTDANSSTKTPKFLKVTSWRTKMNLQNKERYTHSRKVTPMDYIKFVSKGNGTINLPTPSLSKITEILKKRKD